jgi:N-acetylglucosaminyldiphosphoundecaprenol N-acetyl-beta-D-mannosaminyltransferase
MQERDTAGTPEHPLSQIERLSPATIVESASDRNKRRFDFATAAIAIVLSSPLFAIAYVISKLYGFGFSESLRVGKGGLTFAELSLVLPPAWRWSPLSKLPVLINIIRGDMSWVGPVPKSTMELAALGQPGLNRLRVRPGLLCEWRIQQRANMSYGSESESAMEYVISHSFWCDLGILARAITSGLYGCLTHGHTFAEIDLLDIRIDNLTMKEAAAVTIQRLRENIPCQISFVNAHSFNVLRSNPSYMESLRASGLVFADGIGLRIAGHFLGCPVVQNVNGTDLFPLLCKHLEPTYTGLYLLGGKPGVAEGVIKWLSVNYPDLVICGFRHGYDLDGNRDMVLSDIRKSGAELLLVGLGVPTQELWIHQHLGQTGAKVSIGVGGLFDYYSGRIPRAPIWIRELGLEWLFRLLQEPRRLCRRYLIGNLSFLFLVFRYWLRNTLTHRHLLRFLHR